MIDIPDSIFPQDDQGYLLCPRCQKRLEACDCPGIMPQVKKPLKLKPVIHLEKKHRGGKTVTVLEQLPADEVLLKNLSKKLKSATGSGGTYYVHEGMGIIELQGDHREALCQNNLLMDF